MTRQKAQLIRSKMVTAERKVVAGADMVLYDDGCREMRGVRWVVNVGDDVIDGVI